jgi:hypothetical protein
VIWCRELGERERERERESRFKFFDSQANSALGHRVTLTARRLLPVCPQLRTFAAPVGMSQSCQIPDLMHRSKEHVYSINSLAWPLSASGTLMPLKDFFDSVGHFQTSSRVPAGSVCRSKPDVRRQFWLVRFVPKAEVRLRLSCGRSAHELKPAPERPEGRALA